MELTPLFPREKTPVRLAIVEDHAMVRSSIAAELDSHPDLEVAISVADGPTLIRALGQEASIDLCIMDVMMPVMDAFELIPLVRERWPELKILILTGHDFYPALERLAALGVRGCLIKRAGIAELFAATRSVVQTGYYFSGDFTRGLFWRMQSDAVKDKAIKPLELVFLKYCATKMDYREIALKMRKRYRCILGYRDRLFKKLDANNRAQLVSNALKQGLLTFEDLRDPQDNIF